MSEPSYLSTLAEIEELESVPLVERELPASTFEMTTTAQQAHSR